MKIQVTGARGMLGQAVCRAVEAAGHILIKDVNLDILDQFMPCDVLINCAGIVKQRSDLPDFEFARVNAYAPHALSSQCDQAHARLIHVSTDCVFTTYGPHSESETPSPVDMYSRTKYAGEVWTAPHLTVRTSFVGEGKRGLVAELRKADKVVNVSHNSLWTGHTVDTVAHILVTLAERDNIYGLLHIPGEAQTRPELVRKLSDALGLGLHVIENNDPGADRRLISERWRLLHLPEPPPFAEQLKEWAK